ncbi:hypothetical protein ACFSFY_14700 [Sporosarcina siberiensis]|uniref:Uncharacterized protein n=1 Tax=Sporosarcina siberiensis TaxID=1365606 RepID=A0ABW4SJG7_9BACL
MCTENSLDELKELLSKIIEDQTLSLETGLADSYELLALDQLKEVYIKNSMSLLHSLEIMHKEKVIDTNQFNNRIGSLRNILELAQELSSFEKR